MFLEVEYCYVCGPRDRTLKTRYSLLFRCPRSTLAETLLGIETKTEQMPTRGKNASTLAETLLGIETYIEVSIACLTVIPLWLKPF